MEIGQQVRLVLPTIEGQIVDTQYNKSQKQLEHLVEYQGAGEEDMHQRWFLESELEVAEQ